MKRRPILIIAVLITILIEIVLIILVYNKIGNERLPAQIGRLVFQIILILWILSSKSNTALFLLMAYHVIDGLIIINSSKATEIQNIILTIYHFVIGLAIYFHDWIEHKLKKTE